MIVEIHGGNFIGAGAELMLLSAAEWLRNHFQGVRIIVDTDSGRFETRAQHGFFQKFEPERHGRLGWLIRAVMHAGYRGRYGLVLDSESNAVLDVSGYAFGDPFKDEHMRDRAQQFSVWRKQGKIIVMLPQAFGPFERAESREYAKKAFSCCNLIFARDAESVNHLKSLGVDVGRVRLAPDFTVLLRGRIPDECPVTKEDIILVPNAQMLREKPGGMDYPIWLAKVAESLRSHGVRVWLLFHETRMDPPMIAESPAWKELKVPVIETSDAIELKGTLSCAGAVLASRYHAVISTLSQGVPCLGTSWAHKYAALYGEYGVPDWLLDNSASPESTASRLLQMKTEGPKHAAALSAKALEIGRQAEKMWGTVDQQLATVAGR